MTDDTASRKKTKDEIHVHAHTKRLARTMNFQPNDLLKNRAGYLSLRQRQQLRNRMLVSLLAKVGIFLAGVLFSMMAVSSIARADERNFGSANIMPYVLIAGIILGLILLWIGKSIYDLRQDMQGGRVKHFVGPANRRAKIVKRNRSTSSEQYFVKIANKEFDVDEELYKVCQQNHIYCAYFSEKLNQLMSMEVVDSSIHDMPEWMQAAVDNISIDDFKSQSKNETNLISPTLF